MALIASRKSVMTLFTGESDIHSHRVRIVLAEKGITCDTVAVDLSNPPEDLIELNPYSTLPTLVDRELVLYDAQVIMEYLDERFPHPPLMPVDPVARARTRMALRRIADEWDILVATILGGDEKKAVKARKELSESITVIAPIFDQKPFFMSDEFSLVDCVVAPIFWRLPHLGVEVSVKAKGLQQYQKRVFGLPAFKSSLTEFERELRPR